MAPLSINGDVPVVNVFSMNCWGLKYIAKNRVARLNEISLRIARAVPAYDIVALQEFWVYSDYVNLRHKTQNVLPYGKFYFSGAIGGGLVILSKWPFEQSSMFRYPLNGRPTAFFRGDFYVGKGVACASIRHPGGKIIDVFNTHLHAPYEEKDTYLCHRTAQAWEIAKLLRGAVQKGHVAIGLGDFNMIPSSLAHRLISTHGLVSDSWLSAYPDTPDVAPPGRSAQYNIETMGVTCDSVLNTWRMHGLTLPPPETNDPGGKRLDYIFHSPTNSSVRSVKVGMTEPMDMPSQTGGKGGAGRNCSLSDHFSIEVQLALAPNYEQQRALADAKNPTPVSHESLIDFAGPARAREAEMSHQIGEKGGEKYLPSDIIEEIFAVHKEYNDREIKEKKWRIAHFFLSVIVLILLHVAIWWSPHNGVAFLIMVLGWIIAVTGVLDGLIGFMFTGSELRALAEFAEEMKMYQHIAEMSSSDRKSQEDDGNERISIVYE
ncbi:Endonuclease/exonuclease/phosphatase [Sphaerosporella brunnea]|uniref:Endonuclease/exonuclease/phosphatase n=1 Tax=Sphaerosporella brunnea TaxID=1250544 RepID=A0A5J5EYH3_9PEZI|nr:Endonuclease/exonuclease/phosphatase [Sphaerosporella brunnea]